MQGQKIQFGEKLTKNDVILCILNLWLIVGGFVCVCVFLGGDHWKLAKNGRRRFALESTHSTWGYKGKLVVHACMVLSQDKWQSNRYTY